MSARGAPESASGRTREGHELRQDMAAETSVDEQVAKVEREIFADTAA